MKERLDRTARLATADIYAQVNEAAPVEEVALVHSSCRDGDRNALTYNAVVDVFTIDRTNPAASVEVPGHVERVFIVRPRHENCSTIQER